MRFTGDKLAVRLAIVGAVQVFALLFVAALAVPLSFYFQDRASPQGIVRSVQGALGNPSELDRRVTQLHDRHRVGLSLYDSEGELVVSNVQPAIEVRQAFSRGRLSSNSQFEIGPLPPLVGHSLLPQLGEVVMPAELPPPAELGRSQPFWMPRPFDWFSGGRHEPPVMVMPLRSGDDVYTLAVRLPKLSPNYVPLIVIVATGILVVWLGARLTARFITSPLERLSALVGQFGAGELTARSDFVRRDEVGLLANAFNQMADRIQTLRQSERELLSNVAHELRTPLARIRVALEIAEESDGPTAKKSLLGINEDLRELESLIEDVFAATRLQSSSDGVGLVLRKGEVSVAALVDSVVSRFAANHPHRPLTVHQAAGETFLFGDEVLLRRALSNLLENAHKYTPDGDAPITLRVTAVDPHANDAAAAAVWGAELGAADVTSSNDTDAACVFTVEDLGVGIAPSDHGRVFLPFYRAEQSRARATGGVGLGLTLTKRIVEAHAGAIELESQLGRGTKVRLIVPIGLG